MLDTLLKKDLPQAYGLGRANIQLTYGSRTGLIELGDAIACSRCKVKFPERNGCNEKVLKVDASGNVLTVVEYEEYINQFNGTQYAKGGRCDLMMFDEDTHKKIVFCDLGCYSEEYVAKKQKKSHQQVCDSLTRFLKKQCGAAFINLFSEKILIFGRRDPAIDPNNVPEPTRGNVKGNMQVFLAMPISKPKYATQNEVVEGTNVSFIIVNYPEPYIW